MVESANSEEFFGKTNWEVGVEQEIKLSLDIKNYAVLKLSEENKLSWYDYDDGSIIDEEKIYTRNN